MKKLVVLSGVLCLLMSMISFGGSWEQVGSGYRYKKDDGTYVTNAWEWIDTNNDGVAQCFYFNEASFMLSNATTPDGNQVNANGEWVVNGVVQTKQVGTQQSSAIYAPAQNDGNFGITASGDINVPGSTSSESAKKALTSLKAKCNNLVTKMLSEAKKDMKLNSWDSYDISAKLDEYSETADLYLDEYENQVDLIMIEYSLPRTRKDNMMRDGRGAVSEGRANLSSKLRQANAKQKD